MSKYKELEQTRKKTLKDILIEEFEQSQSQSNLAVKLGVTQGTISLWLKHCGLEIRSVLVEKGA